MISFKEAMKRKEILELDVSVTSAAFKQFPKSPNGLTEDAVKRTYKYQAVKENYRMAFERLRSFNKWFLKNYKKEYKQHRKDLTSVK